MTHIHQCAANAPNPTLIRCIESAVIRPDVILPMYNLQAPFELYMVLGIARGVETLGEWHVLVGQFEAYIGGVAGRYQSHRLELPQDATSLTIADHVDGSAYGYQLSGVVTVCPSAVRNHSLLKFRLQLLRYLDEPQG